MRKHFCSDTQRSIIAPAAARSLYLTIYATLAILSICIRPLPVAAQNATDVHFHIVIVEMHDRLTPTVLLDIVKQHAYDITLHPDKQITETVANSDLTGASAHQDPGGSREAALGQDNGVVWRVRGPSALQRTSESNGLLTVWNITVSPNHNCRVQVKMSLRPGLSAHPAKIAGTQTDATFNNYRIRRVDCTVN